MKTQHTPGEWNAKDSIVYSLATGQDIARCDIGGNDEQTEANARLIAEAGTVATETGLTPRQLADQRAELLESCEWALSELAEPETSSTDTLHETIERLKAAIQKATQP